MHLSERAVAIQPSSTLELADRARRLRAAGRPILSFTAGEPDFPTPAPVCAAAAASFADGKVRYTATTGTIELRTAIGEHLTRTRSAPFTAQQIVVTAGVKQAVYYTLLSLLDPGDEVLGIAPYWVSYPWAAHLVGARYCPVPSTADLRPDLDALERGVTDRTRVLLINSPSNPTGVVYDRREMEALVAFAARHDLWLVSDDIYEDLTFPGSTWVSPFHVAPNDERLVCLAGFSKSFAMTGWRVGYIAGSTALTKIVSNVQSHSSGNIAAPSQAAALAALQVGTPFVEAMRDEFARRRDVIVQGLQSIEGIVCPSPGGAFYVFPNVERFLGAEFANDHQLCEALLDTCDVAVVPGSEFGSPGHIRLSYATSLAEIEEGIERLRGFFGARLR